MVLYHRCFDQTGSKLLKIRELKNPIRTLEFSSIQTEESTILQEPTSSRLQSPAIKATHEAILAFHHDTSPILNLGTHLDGEFHDVAHLGESPRLAQEQESKMPRARFLGVIA